MKEPTHAPAYVSLYPMLVRVARHHGYALAAHGSLGNDFDLIAAPWITAADDAETLIRAIAAAIEYARDRIISVDRLFDVPYTEARPHGRQSWCIPLECGARLDISVMPREKVHWNPRIDTSTPIRVARAASGAKAE